MRRSDSAALLERAEHQGTRYDERAKRPYQRALLADAAAQLGCDAGRCKRWRSNRNADLYLMPAGTRTWILKILTSKPVETLECEHASLTELFRIAGRHGGFRVPEPGPLFAGRSAYAMEFVQGRPLHAALLEPGFAGAQAVEALRRAGIALGTIHREWSAGTAEFAVDALVEDLAHLPFEPTPGEAATLSRLAGCLRGRSAARARLYLDFDPVNILLAPEGPPVLLDPPERVAVDDVHWDLGTFLFGIRRAAWRWPPAARRLAGMQEALRHAFLGGYAGAGADPPVPDALLLETGELFRLAQLWRWWMKPREFRHPVVGWARVVYAYPLLRSARRERFDELDRLMTRAANRGH